MDLLNTNNIEPANADIAVMEELWFNNPDPYYLDETERTNIDLRSPPVVRSSTHFDIADYVKLDDSKLASLVTGVTSLHSCSVLGRDSNKELSSIRVKGTSKGCEQSVVDWTI